MGSTTKNISVLAAITTLLAAGIISFGQSTPEIEWYWTHPTTGSTVEFYSAEYELTSLGGTTVTMEIDSIPPGDTEHAWLLTGYQTGATVRLRVAGVDSLQRIGEWSEWSLPWIDDGPPGPPGTPFRFLNY